MLWIPPLESDGFYLSKECKLYCNVQSVLVVLTFFNTTHFFLIDKERLFFSYFSVSPLVNSNLNNSATP